MFEKEIEMQRESREFQLQMMQMMASLEKIVLIVHHLSHHPWQHPLSTPTFIDQCIHLIMMTILPNLND